MTKRIWDLAGSVAKLTRGGFEATIDVAKPRGGLRIHSAARDSSANLCIFGIEHSALQNVTSENLECYARGRDLVAIYDESSPNRLRTQVYWRALEARDVVENQPAESIIAAFDLILSVNTSLLDSDPQVTVRTSLPQSDTIIDLPRANAASENRIAILARLSNQALSYVEIVHPVDACRSWIERNSVGQSMLLNHLLFQRRLEKGVILRARIRAALVKSESDEPLARRAFEHFAASEPPLTA